ncbi:redoxin family protein [Paracoccus halophilus]|nr:redoxin family protein [Paracoccus halophilus]
MLPRSVRAGPGDTAPEFTGLENWINSEPLSMAGLRGRVVLVDFWTFGCSNCVATLPFLTAWHAEMAEKGLTIVGVHTPEFPFERDLGALEKAVGRHGIEYPVSQDNSYATWLAYEVRYWPTSVIVDRDGKIFKYHEGDRGMEKLGDELRAMLV